jgi:glycosyltransferase involved in cell wall biosynthesis
MKLSVLLMTYNHAPFVEQAVRSVLDQQTNFPFEVVIAEDFSTDDTAAIVSRVETAHPDRIRVLRRGRNLGIQDNFIDAYSQCRGEYVATLDGDDYWTAPDKLQRQVNLLDRNPRYSFCFHNVREVVDPPDEGGKVVGATSEGRAGRTEFELEDLVTGNFVPFGSVVARAGLIPEFAPWVREVPGIDWIFGLLNARQGPFARIDGCLGVYRKHSVGVWTSMSWARQINTVLRIYDGIRGDLPSRLGPLVHAMSLNIKLRSEWQLAREKIDELVRSQTGDAFQRLRARNLEIEGYARDLQIKFADLERNSRCLADRLTRLEEYARDRDLHGREEADERIRLEDFTRDLEGRFATLEEYARARDQHGRDVADQFARLEHYTRDLQGRFAALEEYARARNQHGRDVADQFTRLEDYTRNLQGRFAALEDYTRDLQGRFTALEEYTRDLQGRFATLEEYTRTREGTTCGNGVLNGPQPTVWARRVGTVLTASPISTLA